MSLRRVRMKKMHALPSASGDDDFTRKNNSNIFYFLQEVLCVLRLLFSPDSQLFSANKPIKYSKSLGFAHNFSKKSYAKNLLSFKHIFERNRIYELPLEQQIN